MIDPIGVSVGGLIGAIIGAFWGDPFRNDQGEYLSHGDGFLNWVTQVLVGGGVGTAVTQPAKDLVRQHPLVGAVVIMLTAYMIYIKRIDPR